MIPSDFFCCSLGSLVLLLAAPAHGQVGQMGPHLASMPITSTLPAGSPLRVELDRRYSLKPGTRVEGHLISPVYRVDHEVLPVNTKVTGSITGKHAVNRGLRANALLNGDFTPLAVAEISFDHLWLPDGESVSIATRVTERTAGMVRMGSRGKRPSLVSQAKTQIQQRKQDALDTFQKPGKSDRLLRYLYGQLPYHPQRIWMGTQYDADLTQPLMLAEKSPQRSWPLMPLSGTIPIGRIEAMLTAGLTSATTKPRSPVEAMLSKPLFDPTHEHLLLPEGARLTGSVVQVKPAAWFGRSGRLRFTFRRLELSEGAEPVPVHGQIASAEAGQGQNLSIDQEGGAKAGSNENKLLAPLTLGLLAASSMDRDREGSVVKNGVVSNGFGIVVRVVTMATSNRNLASGFAYFALAKSVYRRWIAKGHEVEFPKDTRLEIDLSER